MQIQYTCAVPSGEAHRTIPVVVVTNCLGLETPRWFPRSPLLRVLGGRGGVAPLPARAPPCPPAPQAFAGAASAFPVRSIPPFPPWPVIGLRSAVPARWRAASPLPLVLAVPPRRNSVAVASVVEFDLVAPLARPVLAPPVIRYTSERCRSCAQSPPQSVLCSSNAGGGRTVRQAPETRDLLRVYTRLEQTTQSADCVP